MFNKLLQLTKGKIKDCINQYMAVLEDRIRPNQYKPRLDWDLTITNQERFKFFDLVKMHLEDHGYKAILLEFPYGTPKSMLHDYPKKTHCLIIFNSRIKYWLNMRHNTIAFEIGRPREDGMVYNLVWMFRTRLKYLKNNPSIMYYNTEDDRILCDINNPQCLDIILKEVQQHYGSN